jgi:hypothetical protein
MIREIIRLQVCDSRRREVITVRPQAQRTTSTRKQRRRVLKIQEVLSKKWRQRSSNRNPDKYICRFARYIKSKAKTKEYLWLKKEK